MSWLLVVMGMASVAVAVATARRDDRRRRSVWRQVALARGGMYHAPYGFIRARSERLDVDVDQVRVRIDRHQLSASSQQGIHTRCRARFLLPRGPVFCIYPEGVMASIGKVLGGHDVRLETDRAFDERFIVKCDDAEAVRRVWSPLAMRIMRRSFDKARIESDGAVLELSSPDPLDVFGLVDEALDLIAEIAGADIFGLAALRALPGAAYQPPTGIWDQRTIPHVVLARPVPVTIGPAVLGRRAVTRASIGDGPRERPLKILVRSDGSAEPADSVAALPPAAAGFLRRAGNGTLVVDGARTSFTWLDLETDHARLLAGAGLLTTLASGPGQGVYR